MKKVLFLFWIGFSISFGLKPQETFIGKYRYDYNIRGLGNRGYAEMNLNADGSFTFNCLFGAQAEISGTYRVKKGLIYFKKDFEFTYQGELERLTEIQEETPELFPNGITNMVFEPLPDFESTPWKIKASYLRPKKKIWTGCFDTRGKFYKIN